MTAPEMAVKEKELELPMKDMEVSENNNFIPCWNNCTFMFARFLVSSFFICRSKAKPTWV